MKEIMDLGDDAEDLFDIVPIKENFPDFLTLARMQKERGYNMYSQPISHRASVNTRSRQARWPPQQLPQQKHQQLKPSSAKHLHTHSSSNTLNGI